MSRAKLWERRHGSYGNTLTLIALDEPVRAYLCLFILCSLNTTVQYIARFNTFVDIIASIFHIFLTQSLLSTVDIVLALV